MFLRLFVHATPYRAFCDIHVQRLDSGCAGKELKAMRAYPNPTSGGLTLEISNSGDDAAPAIISCVDALGRTLFRKDLEVRPGLTAWTHDFSGTASGLYHIIISYGDNTRESFSINVMVE